MPLAACFLSLRDILRALEFLVAQIHSFRMSRKNAANWGRFPKNVIFGRAVNYFEIIYSRKQNRAFALAHPNLPTLWLTKRVNLRLYIMVWSP